MYIGYTSVMISLNLKEGTLQLSTKRLGLIVEKSTLPGIYQYDEVVEINNVRADILDKATLQNKLSELISTSNLLILPKNKQQLIQTCLNANNIYFEKKILTTCFIKVQFSSDGLIQVINTIFHKENLS